MKIILLAILISNRTGVCPKTYNNIPIACIRGVFKLDGGGGPCQ